MSDLDRATASARVAEARVGRLATVTGAGDPHVVPCCFVLEGDRLYSAVDGKPKSTTALKRLDNVRARPTASLLVDHYADDWAELWWVRVDGTAALVTDDGERSVAVAALAAKYEQYRADPPSGPVLRIDITRWASWAHGAGGPPSTGDR